VEHTGATSICHVTMAGKNLRTPDELAISWTNRRDSEWSPKSKVRWFRWSNAIFYLWAQFRCTNLPPRHLATLLGK